MTLKMGLNKLCKVLLQWEIHFLDALRSTIMKSKPIETICSQTHYKKWIKGVSFIRNYTSGQWGSITRLFSFINCVDNVNWPLYLLYRVI